MAKVKEKAPKFPPRDEVNGTSTKPLTHADRCDRCSAQALVRVMFALSVLDFCGHHYAKHEPALIGQGFHVEQDNRKEVG